MPTRKLPANPSLEHLKHQAKDLLRQHVLKDPAAAQRLREFHPALRHATDDKIFSTPLSLSDAHLAIAREYGFASWPRLKRHIEDPALSNTLERLHHNRIDDPTFRRAVSLIDSGDVRGLARLLLQDPKIIHQRVLFEGGNYFRNPSLLEFIAENPVRHGTMPPDIVDVARLLLEAGPESSAVNETLGLVASGRVPREEKRQLPLLELLCSYGADPASALPTAVLHAEFDAARHLIHLGAKPDLSTYAALGDTPQFLDHLPTADPNQRHLALALAAQYGHAEIVRALLDADEDPNRYNPPGSHSHSTPLHEAALAGHIAVVQLLVERGARLDTKDVLWGGTPAGWAHHNGHSATEAYLQEHAAAAAPKIADPS